MYNRNKNTGSWVSGASSHRYSSYDDYGMDSEEGSYSRFQGGQNQQSVGGHGTSFSSGRYTGLSNESGGSYRGTNMDYKQRSYDTHSQKGSFNQKSTFYSMDYQRGRGRGRGNFYDTSQTWKGGMEAQESFDQDDDERNNVSGFQKRGGFYRQGGGAGVGTFIYSQRKERDVHQGGRSVFDPERLGEAPYEGQSGRSSFDPQRLGEALYEGQDRRSSFDPQRLAEAPCRGQQKIGNESLLGEPFGRNQSLLGEPLGGNQSLLGEPLGGSQSLLGEPLGGSQSLLGEPLGGSQSLLGEPLVGNRSLLGKPLGGNLSVMGPQRGGNVSLMGAPTESSSLLGEPPGWQRQSQSRPGMEEVVGDIVNQVLDLQGGRSGSNTQGHRSRFGEHSGSFSKWKGSSSQQQQQQHPWNDHNRYSLNHRYSSEPQGSDFGIMQQPQSQQQVSGLGNLHQSFSPYPTERFQQQKIRGKNKKYGKKKGPKTKKKPATGQNEHLQTYSPRVLKQMEAITKNALHCNLCKPFKFQCVQNTVHEYLAHQSKPKHLRYRAGYNAKVNFLVAYLLADAQLSFARKYGTWDAGEDLCDMCKVPKTQWGQNHVKIFECWVNHEYNQPTCVCNSGKFQSRLVFEEHCLTPLHLKSEYDYRTSKGVEFRVGKAEVKLMTKHFKSGVGLAYESFNNFILDKRVIVNEGFGIDPVPTQISWLLDAFKKMQCKTVQRQKINDSRKIPFQYYNPTIPKGPEPIVFDAEFECSLCNVTLGTSKQSVLDHCATEQHCENINDEEKLGTWVSERADEAAGRKKRYIPKGLPDNFKKDGIQTNVVVGDDDDEDEDEDYEMDDD